MRRRRLLYCFAAAALLLGAAPDYSKQDVAFLRTALASGRTELAQAAAQQRSDDPNVRFYAQSMTIDHTTIDLQLREIAKAQGIPLAKAPRVSRPASSSLSSAQYLQGQISGHQSEIALYRQELDSGQNAALQAYAKQVVPVLESHLCLAQNLLDRERGVTALPRALPSSGTPQCLPTLQFGASPAPSPSPAATATPKPGQSPGGRSADVPSR